MDAVRTNPAGHRRLASSLYPHACPPSPLARRRTTTLALARASSRSSTSTSSSEPPRSILGPAGNRRRPGKRAPAMVSGRSPSPSDDAPVGAKRKRAPSGTENAGAPARTASAGRPGGIKRQRSESVVYDSDDEPSEMDVDDAHHSFPSPEDSDEAFDSGDEFWLQEADLRALQRLKKDELVRLYQAAGLTADPDPLKKSALAQAIVDVRDDAVTLPPSSPPGPGSQSGSDVSSDDGTAAGDESPDRSSPVRRRVTVHDVAQTLPPARATSTAKALKSRSASVGFLPKLTSAEASSSRRVLHPTHSPSEGVARRRTASLLANGRQLPSPPATRQRSKASSSALPDSDASGGSARTRSSGKARARHVGFVDDALPVLAPPAPAPADDDAELSDLTDLTSSGSEREGSGAQRTPRPRRTPARRAKARVGSLAEESDVSTDAEAEAEAARAGTGAPPSPTPRRTPLRNRLRPRRGAQMHTPPSDGDDEDEGSRASATPERDPDALLEEDEETEEEDELAEATPKRLRSGRILSKDAAESEVDEEDELVSQVDEDADEDGSTVVADDAMSVAESVPLASDEEGEEDAEDGDELEENVDLTVATVKTLVRLRRDELVRMCETREIEAEGTKPQLAEALLQWRDHAASSVQSSAGTARPPSTARPAARGARQRSSRSGSGARTPVPVPVLLRSHVHVEQPRTPPVSGPQTPRQGVKEAEDGELELDLGSLGLDDREIPCEKLTKLEKIGSGGFKDVFIGRLKGRKVAIAEFRGQLTAMDIKELKLLGEFDHPNIVRFFGVSIPENTKETPVMVVSELCSNGDLFDYIRNVPAPKLSKVIGIMLDIARGIEYLHLRKPSVIHRDCKSSNILITSRATAKVTDFGLAKVKESTRSMVRSLVGTVNWQAPELWHPAPRYNHKVDVFSLAMVFWEMLQWHVHNKKFPWEGMNEHAIYDLVGQKRQRPSVSGLRKQWCPEIVELMERMWVHEAHDRPTMSQVVEELEVIHQQYK